MTAVFVILLRRSVNWFDKVNCLGKCDYTTVQKLPPDSYASPFHVFIIIKTYCICHSQQMLSKLAK